MTLATLLPLFIKLSLALLVLSLGLSATLADTTYLLRRPRELVRALVALFVLVPLAAIVLARGLDLHPAVKIALVALAVSPLPPTFPQKALKQGGRVSYTAGLLVAATLLSIILVPLTLRVVQAVFDVPVAMRAATVLGLVFWSLLLPLGIGLAIRRLAPAFAERAASPVLKVANILLVVGFLPILVRVWPAMMSLVGNGTILVIVVFVLVALAGGHLLGGPDPEDRTVLAISTATRHPAIAIAIAHANFPDQKLAPAAILLYVLVSALAAAPYLKWSRRQRVAAPAAVRT